jgi:hypothetical protein
VAKLSSDGSTLSYSTYLGGSDRDVGRGIAVDRAGRAYVTGTTDSTDFPTASPLDGALGGGRDAFVAKLSPTGSTLSYSTYLGGSDRDVGRGIAVDRAGRAYVTGETFSTDFPTANPLDGTGGFDAFVVKLSRDGRTLRYSTYLGGSGIDFGSGIAVDRAGRAYVTGTTGSTDFPTANPLQGTLGGGFDAFVAKLSRDGRTLRYSTYLGGSSSDVGSVIITGCAPEIISGSGDDVGCGIAVDRAGRAYVTGLTVSTDFPTANPLDGTLSGVFDAFVVKLSRDGRTLRYSTYLGGSDDDGGIGIAVDRAGSAYVTELTRSTDFPTANPLDGTLGGGLDAFVVKILP